jgi:hypothetical protein
MSTATKLTPEQAHKLEQAIEWARFPAGCEYVGSDGEPACVIAQLAALEGVDALTLDAWDNTTLPGVSSLRPAELAAYPIELLAKLQQAWDNTHQGLEATGRRAMRAILAAYR